MYKRFFILLTVMLLLFSVSSGFADKADGDLYTFCPYLSTEYYNTLLKNFLDLNDAQAALLKVSSNGLRDGNLVYTNMMQDTIFIFSGTTEEFGTATSAYIYCSTKDSSKLKNVPMLLWAAQIDQKYNGEIKETGSSFLEWVNDGKTNGETFTSPYFTALYKEERGSYCSLLLMRN